VSDRRREEEDRPAREGKDRPRHRRKDRPDRENVEGLSRELEDYRARMREARRARYHRHAHPHSDRRSGHSPFRGPERPPYPYHRPHPSDPNWQAWDRWWRHQRHLHARLARKRGRSLFLRFFLVFGVVALLSAGGIAAFAALVARVVERQGAVGPLVWAAGCGLSLALPLLALSLAIRGFRGIAHPLADVMEAAEAVAGGDLTARIEETSHGPFGKLGRTFNRMVEELARTEEQRRNLTADVAHELRTPLHIIQGNLEGILDGVYEPTAEHITATLEETHLLARLIEDLRMLSAAESGQLVLRKEPVRAGDLLADAATSFGGGAEAAGIDLRVEAADDAANTILAVDAARVSQVLGNLVANALRYTPQGGAITLGARRAKGGVVLTVRDTGEGIPAEDLPYVFDRFWRGDRARTHAEGVGGGLGLPIARQLVELHGGRIEVDSAAGQGTIFTIWLPLDGASAQGEPAGITPSGG
jgi:signal transduction histidine kinase